MGRCQSGGWTSVGIGIDTAREYRMLEPSLSAGRRVEADDEVVISPDLADELKAKPGDVLEVVRFGKPMSLEVVGVSSRGDVDVVRRTEAVVTRAALSEISGVKDRLTEIAVVLREGADAKALSERYQALVPKNVIVQTTALVTSGVGKAVRANTLGSIAASALAYFACALIILTGLTTGVLERQREQMKGKTLATLEVNQVREGTVTSVMAYGAFVDVGGLDGLVHVSDISYSRVESPSDVLKVGDKVQVKILKIDAEHGKVSLGIKQIEPDPWSLIAQSLRVGDSVQGRVTRTAPFGCFVEVDKGVEGLCPISELSWKRVGRVEDVVQHDQVHMFKILELDPVKRRIALSLKQAAGDPWIGASVTFAPRTVVDGTVLTCTDFGAFVELKAGIEGLVHISELDYKRVNKVTDIIKPGDVKQFKILTVDEENRRISLSLKQVNANPMAAVAAEEAEARAAARAADNAAREAADAAAAAAAAKRPKPVKSGVGGLGKSGALGMGLRDLKF